MSRHILTRDGVVVYDYTDNVTVPPVEPPVVVPPTPLTTRQKVNALYQEVFGRDGDAGGLDWWASQVDSGAKTLDQVRQAFMDSDEAKKPVVTPPPVVGDVNLDIYGRVIPAPTGPAGASMGEQPGNPVFPGSGAGPCGSYEIPLGTCSVGMTGANSITRAWMYILEDIMPGSPRLGNSCRIALPFNNAFVFRFKTGPALAYPMFPYPVSIAIDENTARGPFVPHFVSLSETRGDFNYAQIGRHQAYRAMSGSDSMLARVYDTNDVDPTTTFPFVPLKCNTVYYLNVRLENALAAPGWLQLTSGTGGLVIGFN